MERGETILVSDKGVTGPAFAYIKADGEPVEVAIRIEERVLDVKPWLVG